MRKIKGQQASQIILSKEESRVRDAARCGGSRAVCRSVRARVQKKHFERGSAYLRLVQKKK